MQDDAGSNENHHKIDDLIVPDVFHRVGGIGNGRKTEHERNQEEADSKSGEGKGNLLLLVTKECKSTDGDNDVEEVSIRFEVRLGGKCEDNNAGNGEQNNFRKKMLSVSV